ncbi:MAG: ferritin-like domain-containing protein [Pirellulales bacterium]
MPNTRNIDVLNHLLATLQRSLAEYLQSSRYWTHRGDERAEAIVLHLVEDQRAYMARLASLILERHGQIEPSSFPMEFTDLNLLSLDYLLQELVGHQRATIETIEECIDDLGADRPARELAEEILGNARGHLENLESVVKVPA